MPASTPTHCRPTPCSTASPNCQTLSNASASLLDATGYPVAVKNQARMQTQNGDLAYMNSADALRRWPETCTAIAARSVVPRIEILAPFGIDDLVSLIFSCQLETMTTNGQLMPR